MMRIVQIGAVFPLRSPKKAQNRNADDGMISTTDTRPTSATIVIIDKLNLFFVNGFWGRQSGQGLPAQPAMIATSARQKAGKSSGRRLLIW